MARIQKKQKIVLLIGCVILLAAVVAGVILFAVGNTAKTYSPDQIVNHFNTVVVYQVNGNYDVVVKNNEKEYTIVFSRDRKVLKNQGIDLIKLEDIQTCMGLPEEELHEKLGPMHADTGSGFRFQSYITETGYLVDFYLKDGRVFNFAISSLFGNLYAYSESDFVFVEVGKTCFEDITIMPESVWEQPYGLECLYPLEGGGYMVIKFYDKDLVVGAIERNND